MQGTKTAKVVVLKYTIAYAHYFIFQTITKRMIPFFVLGNTRTQSSLFLKHGVPKEYQVDLRMELQRSTLDRKYMHFQNNDQRQVNRV